MTHNATQRRITLWLSESLAKSLELRAFHENAPRGNSAAVAEMVARYEGLLRELLCYKRETLLECVHLWGPGPHEVSDAWPDRIAIADLAERAWTLAPDGPTEETLRELLDT